jgi:hypothetical protein
MFVNNYYIFLYSFEYVKKLFTSNIYYLYLFDFIKYICI